MLSFNRFCWKVSYFLSKNVLAYRDNYMNLAFSTHITNKETGSFSIAGKCRDPPVVPHANHDGPKGVRIFPLGTQLTYSCADGYNIDGFFRAMCVGEGRWVGPRMTCSRKCFHAVNYGVLDFQSSSWRKHRALGLSWFKSKQRMHWNPVFSMYQCFLIFVTELSRSYQFSARRCPHPGDIPHGRREGNVFIFPNRVTYICSEGYELVGRPYRVCQASGQWSGTTPMCRRMSSFRILPFQYCIC